MLSLCIFWPSCEDGTVSCDSTIELWGTVHCIEDTVELDLTSSNLSGEIPSEIAQLVNLIKLDLKNNSLSGIIPSSLSNLQNLIELNLYDNQLTGQIDAAITDKVLS